MFRVFDQWRAICVDDQRHTIPRIAIEVAVVMAKADIGLRIQVIAIEQILVADQNRLQL